MEMATHPQHAGPPIQTWTRWLWIWITIGALVVIVVIGFLIGIVSALNSINDNLFETDTAVTGAGHDTDPLPAQIGHVNSTLGRIDTSLRPIPGQAQTILSSVRAIRGSLTKTDASLKNTSGSLVDTSNSLVDTSGSLVDTSRSLVNTSGTVGDISRSLVNTTGSLVNTSNSLVDTSRVLVNVRALAANIESTLIRAQVVPSLGTNAIWRRVRFLNGGSFTGPNGTMLGGSSPNPNGLNPALTDANNILSGLKEVNKHLTSVCGAPVLRLPIPTLVKPGPC